jgi:hypothetical protein
VSAYLFWTVDIGFHLCLVFLSRNNFSLIIFLIWVFFRGLWFGWLIRLLSEKRRLQGKCTHNVKFSENHYTSSRFFAFLNSEPAISEFKMIRRLVTAQQRHHTYLSILNSPLMFIILICARIKESILFAWMPVQVTVHKHTSLIMHVSHEMLSIKYGRVQEYIGTDPPPIKVDSQEWTPLVAENNSIYI